MMTAIVEARTIAAVLGLRLLDQTTGLPVATGQGFEATAIPLAQPSAPVAGLVGPSGIVSFHELSGVRDLEFPTDQSDGPASFPGGVAFLVLIEDHDGRFLREIFTVQLPLDPAGVVLPLLDVPLFSAPTRPVTPGLAAIRADLRDLETGEPVPYAVLRVDVAGVTGVGIADDGGRTLVLVETPVVDRLRLGSPPGTGQGALGRQTWHVTARVFALPGPAALVPDRPPLRPPWDTMPSLKTLLTDQPQVPVCQVAGTSESEWSGTLVAGRELVLRTDSSSHLLISRGASPP